jgi:tetratricopeptide (TPR) repeat protein
MKNTTKADSGETKNTPVSFDAQELFALARLDLERGSLEQALFKIKQLIADPEAPNEAFGFAGRLYAQLGIWDRAKELFQRYLKLNPKAVTEAFQLGMVHFDSLESNEALEIWSELLQREPAHPPSLFYSALALAQQGKLPEARHNLDVLLKSASTDNLYFNRAKELLQSIDAHQPQDNVQKKEALPAMTKDAYKTEH